MKKLVILMVGLVLTLAGCGLQEIQPIEITCQCKDNFEQFTGIRSVDAFAINGKAQIKFDDGKNKINESYDVKFHYETPSNLYLQATHILMPKAIIAGGSSDEFWLWIRHKEVSSFWSGNWDRGCVDATTLAINPGLMLEAMNLRGCSAANSEVQVEGEFYVVLEIDDSGNFKKKYYDCCEKLLRRIEYYDFNGQLIQTAKVAKYFIYTCCSDFYLPLQLEFEILQDGNEIGNVVIQYNRASYKKRDYSEKFRQRFFTKPEASNTRNIYKMNDVGNFLKIK